MNTLWKEESVTILEGSVGQPLPFLAKVCCKRMLSSQIYDSQQVESQDNSYAQDHANQRKEKHILTSSWCVKCSECTLYYHFTCLNFST